MGITSVMLPDETILNRIDGMKSVAVIGCKGCANSSIAYTRKLPIYRIEVDADTEEITRFPAALPAELDRLKDLIESKGTSVKTEMLLSPCVIARAPGMKPLGVFCRRTIVDKEKGLEYINWDRAQRILLFKN